MLKGWTCYYHAPYYNATTTDEIVGPELGCVFIFYFLFFLFSFFSFLTTDEIVGPELGCVEYEENTLFCVKENTLFCMKRTQSIVREHVLY